MPGMLIAYDDAGNVIATLDHVVAHDASGNAIGLIDFAAHEEAGGEHTDIWYVTGTTTSEDGTETPWVAKGSKVWPEWLGGRAHDFRVELEGPPGRKRISALVHKTSGHRRERAAVEAAIAAVAVDPVTGARDIRHLVGGPTRPLPLDADGKTIGPDHPQAPKGTPAHLPIMR